MRKRTGPLSDKLIYFFKGSTLSTMSVMFLLAPKCTNQTRAKKHKSQKALYSHLE